MRIGTFIEDKQGMMHGKINAIGIGVVSVMLEPQTSRDGKEYFRIIADPVMESYEIGRAFRKQKDGMPYFSVSLDSPAFSGPMNAALFPDKEKPLCFNLVWNRPEPMTVKTEPSPKTNGKSRKNADWQPAP